MGAREHYRCRHAARGSLSGAGGINNRGQVVGSSGTATATGNETHAFLWDHGTITDLGRLPEGNASEAFSINNRGQVAGDSGTEAEESFFTATLWTLK